MSGPVGYILCTLTLKFELTSAKCRVHIYSVGEMAHDHNRPIVRNEKPNNVEAHIDCGWC